MERYLRTSLVALVLLLLQTTIIQFLSLNGLLPDLLLIWVVYIAIRRGQVEAALSGFVVGCLQDVTTIQFFGLAALAKTVGGFAAGYFFNQNRTEETLGTYRFALIILLASFIHDMVYYAIFFQGIDVPLVTTTLRWSFFSALYTGLVGLLPMFFYARKYARM